VRAEGEAVYREVAARVERSGNYERGTTNEEDQSRTKGRWMANERLGK
jgi:hypothetical protein